MELTWEAYSKSTQRRVRAWSARGASKRGEAKCSLTAATYIKARYSRPRPSARNAPPTSPDKIIFHVISNAQTKLEWMQNVRKWGARGDVGVLPRSREPPAADSLSRGPGLSRLAHVFRWNNFAPSILFSFFLLLFFHFHFRPVAFPASSVRRRRPHRRALSLCRSAFLNIDVHRREQWNSKRQRVPLDAATGKSRATFLNSRVILLLLIVAADGLAGFPTNGTVNVNLRDGEECDEDSGMAEEHRLTWKFRF